jgi:hypothetical protein
MPCDRVSRAGAPDECPAEGKEIMTRWAHLRLKWPDIYPDRDGPHRITKSAQEPFSGGDFYTLCGVKPSHDTVLGDVYQRRVVSGRLSPSSSSNALTSWRSVVPKPSVNQPEFGWALEIVIRDTQALVPRRSRAGSRLRAGLGDSERWCAFQSRHSSPGYGASSSLLVFRGRPVSQ